MRQVAGLIVATIATRDDHGARHGIAADVRDICARFPVPGLPEA
jgi:hypothetical protein